MSRCSGEEAEAEAGRRRPDSYDHRRAHATRSRSRSPAGRRRPVAADYFDEARSRSPEDERERERRPRRRRSGSPRAVGGGDVDHEHHREHKRRKREHRHRHHHHHRSHATPAVIELPFGARQLSSKHDLQVLEPLFASYLDIQKGLDFYALDSHEQRGRWKSFVNKWNRGELAEGWYDPEMFERLAKESSERPPPAVESRSPGSATQERRGSVDESGWSVDQSPPPRDRDEGDDEDDYGPPPPPGQSSTQSGYRQGPGIPSLSDLALQREAASEDAAARIADVRLARKADRAQQKERLEELVPRAEPGTRERQLEKRAAVNEKMKGFRDAAGAGDMEEVGDGDLMGGGDGVDDYKRAAMAQQRKKTERELRREAEARARREEREERLREWREKEEEKLRGLKELARARFG